MSSRPFRFRDAVENLDALARALARVGVKATEVSDNTILGRCPWLPEPIEIVWRYTCAEDGTEREDADISVRYQTRVVTLIDVQSLLRSNHSRPLAERLVAELVAACATLTGHHGRGPSWSGTPQPEDGFVAAVGGIARTLFDLDRRLVVFGAKEHGYAFYPVLSEARLVAYEERHSVRLPADYRAFLARAGNGGVGPQYGVLPLSEHEPAAQESWPYEGTAEFEGDAPLPGCVPIADLGCGQVAVLVVKGPCAGQVWHDERDGAGVFPLRLRAGGPVSFSTWWLAAMEPIAERFVRVRAEMERGTPHEAIHAALDGPHLQLDVDLAIASLLDVALEGKPAVVPDKPWGVACGLVDEHYGRWLARRPRP